MACRWANSTLSERDHLAEEGIQEVNENIHGSGLGQQTFCPHDEGLGKAQV
jgi:hypothetical protein